MAEETLTKPIKETLGSVISFSGAVYVIILTLSICYNIGYLKQINPQIIDLLEISDYIDATIHNIWFFLLGAILFFSGSLAFIKMRVREEFNKVLTFGVFTFIISAYFLLKGVYYSKYWPTLSQMINNNPSYSIIFLITTAVAICFLFVLFYRISIKLMNERGTESKVTFISAGAMPIFILLFLVLMPYIGGMAQGYVENKYFTKQNYDVYHSVDIHVVLPGDEVLKNVFVIKKLNKGIIVRQFNANAEDTFKFLNWGYIRTITYKRVGELLSPI